MWLNAEQVSDSAIKVYQNTLKNTCPNHIVIDNLFIQSKLDEVTEILQQSGHWKTQRHTYSALYVDYAQWHNTNKDLRFVQRDVWQRDTTSSNKGSAEKHQINIAQDFLLYLRSDEFMSLISNIFNVKLTDINVAKPKINTNYFRLGAKDFVEQHADDSPGRKVCMLLYLNKGWNESAGGKLVFNGFEGQSISIPPLYSRCVLFDPSSQGSEHWVEKLNTKYPDQYRYNVTSWYWSE